MKEAITKAIEGGYVRGSAGRGEFLLGLPDYAKSQIWLDPLFWQALMIGCGFDVKEGTMRCEHYHPRYNEPGQGGCNADKCSYAGYKDWQEVWHQFINHLAEGKDAESFFKKLLPDTCPNGCSGGLVCSDCPN